MKIRYEDQTHEINPDDLTLGEGHEAELYLKLSVDSAQGLGLMMLVLFISMRRADPDRDPAVVAEEVRNAKITKLESEDDEDADAVPPAPSAGTGELHVLEQPASAQTPEDSGHPASANASA